MEPEVVHLLSRDSARSTGARVDYCRLQNTRPSSHNKGRLRVGSQGVPPENACRGRTSVNIFLAPYPNGLSHFIENLTVN